jgi:hypothetical protein
MTTAVVRNAMTADYPVRLKLDLIGSVGQLPAAALRPPKVGPPMSIADVLWLGVGQADQTPARRL